MATDIEKTENMIRALSVCIATKTPCLLVGEPGVAKTAIVEALFGALTVAHDTRIASLSEPVDFGGFPVPRPELGRVALLPAAWLSRLSEESEKGTVGLFLDEFSNAPPAVRAAALRGILDGQWGDLKIGNIATVAAMNPPEISESGYSLSAPLANRFVHLNWAIDSEWWDEQQMQDFPAPLGLVVKVPADFRETHLSEAKTLVSAYRRRFGNTAMQAVPKSRDQQSGPFPTFRSWTVARDLLAACLAAGFGLLPDPSAPGVRRAHNVLQTLIEGAVGTGAAGQFLGYVEALDLPDPETLLRNPSSLELPRDRGDKAFAVLQSVVSVVLSRNTNDRWHRAWSVMARAKDLGREDLAVCSCRALARSRPSDWNKKYPEASKALLPALKEAGIIAAC